MIRYIYIGDQIVDDGTDFAFYDTVTDHFLDFDGAMSFSDPSEFREWAMKDSRYVRCERLIPKEQA